MISQVYSKVGNCPIFLVYKEKKGRGLMGTDGRICPHNRWGGYLDAHHVLVLAQNAEMGTDAQVHQLVIDGS